MGRAYRLPERQPLGIESLLLAAWEIWLGAEARDGLGKRLSTRGREVRRKG